MAKKKTAKKKTAKGRIEEAYMRGYKLGIEVGRNKKQAEILEVLGVYELINNHIENS